MTWLRTYRPAVQGVGGWKSTLMSTPKLLNLNGHQRRRSPSPRTPLLVNWILVKWRDGRSQDDPFKGAQRFFRLLRSRLFSCVWVVPLFVEGDHLVPLRLEREDICLLYAQSCVQATLEFVRMLKMTEDEFGVLEKNRVSWV
jgi:hypothetical protein